MILIYVQKRRSYIWWSGSGGSIGNHNGAAAVQAWIYVHWLGAMPLGVGSQICFHGCGRYDIAWRHAASYEKIIMKKKNVNKNSKQLDKTSCCVALYCGQLTFGKEMWPLEQKLGGKEEGWLMESLVLCPATVIHQKGELCRTVLNASYASRRHWVVQPLLLSLCL